MSADAKVWQADHGDWEASHDGNCMFAGHGETAYGLTALLEDIEACFGHALRWELRIYPDGKAGLVGYEA